MTAKLILHAFDTNNYLKGEPTCIFFKKYMVTRHFTNLLYVNENHPTDNILCVFKQIQRLSIGSKMLYLCIQVCQCVWGVAIRGSYGCASIDCPPLLRSLPYFMSSVSFVRRDIYFSKFTQTMIYLIISPLGETIARFG